MKWLECLDKDLNYYVDIVGDFYVGVLLRTKTFLFDDDEIPMVKYRLTDPYHHYNPSIVCIWGLYNLNR